MAMAGWLNIGRPSCFRSQTFVLSNPFEMAGGRRVRIDYIKISNVMSFPYVEQIEDAESINFESGLNIIIGENGSGKSTALEVINFLFKRVIYRQFTVNEELLGRRTTITESDRKQTLSPSNQLSISGFRLDKNWYSIEKPQTIRIALRLDEIDMDNIATVRSNFAVIQHTGSSFSSHQLSDNGTVREKYIIDVTLDPNNNSFAVSHPIEPQDFGFTYLTDYHYIKHSIFLHNLFQNDGQDPIPTLFESFTLISSYRNYHAFSPSVSLQSSPAAQQMQAIRSKDYDRSLNATDTGEPAIFSLVRLQVAERHYNLVPSDRNIEQCESEANIIPFLGSINDRLRIVNLECKITLLERRTWDYRFEFFDIRRQQTIQDINCLSAGQKAIIHLVFEAYGRGDLKGGVVIIDEPEIHLHYQFQHEYLQVIQDLNKTQNCQYILVTHSEALINSNTINNVRRFSLDQNGHTKIYSPCLTTDEKSLIQILDNTRSTYAFFAKKVVLVEGDSDQYFFKAVLKQLFPRKEQEVAILHIGGKESFPRWTALFSAFGLVVSQIADLDYLYNLHYTQEQKTKLASVPAVRAFKTQHPDWQTHVVANYAKHIYILQSGDLEAHLRINKGLQHVIEFCRDHLTAFLSNSSLPENVETHAIVNSITH